MRLHCGIVCWCSPTIRKPVLFVKIVFVFLFSLRRHLGVEILWDISCSWPFEGRALCHNSLFFSFFFYYFKEIFKTTFMICVRFRARRQCYVLTVVMNVELGWAEPNWMWNALAWWSPFSPNCEQKSLKFGWKTCSLNASNSSSLRNLNHLYLLSATFLQWNKSLFLQTLMEWDKLQPPVRMCRNAPCTWNLDRNTIKNFHEDFEREKDIHGNRKWFLTKAYWDTGGMKLLARQLISFIYNTATDSNATELIRSTRVWTFLFLLISFWKRFSILWRRL